MRESKFHFLEDAKAKKINESLKKFQSGQKSEKEFLLDLKEKLPVNKMDKITIKARVEGFYDISEKLFQELLKLGKAQVKPDFSHNDIISRAKLRPFSFYHYQAGSREPAVNVRTRDDYFNDPSTALIKLEDDIIALGKLYKELTGKSDSSGK